MELRWREADWIDLWEPPLGHRCLEFHVITYKLEVESAVFDISRIFATKFRCKFSSEGLILADHWKRPIMGIDVDWRLSLHILRTVKLDELFPGHLNEFVSVHLFLSKSRHGE